MYKNYIFPIHIFLILEKTSCKLWLNRHLDVNNFYLIFSISWTLPLIQILKKELFLSNNFLIENTAVDSIQESFENSKRFFFFYFKTYLTYQFYFYQLKIKLTLILINNKQQKQKFISLQNYFSNANWLERETSEMYGLFFSFKQDTRKLLLDYSKIENPMLKHFPCEGLTDVFYNFFYQQVITTKNEVVEL